MSLPFNHSTAGVRGAAVDTAIPVPAILSSSTLLCVIEHDGAGPTAGHDPDDFSVSDGEIESATVGTDGSYLHLIWAD